MAHSTIGCMACFFQSIDGDHRIAVNALALWFRAIPDAKPVSTLAGIALGASSRDDRQSENHKERDDNAGDNDCNICIEAALCVRVRRRCARLPFEVI
jgi:hypothetical protein